MSILVGWRKQRYVGGTAAALLLLGALLLFLSAAGTIDVGFTVKPSYGLLLIADAIGLPWALQGWLKAPRRLRQAAILLVAIYLIGVIAGHHLGLPSQRGRSGHRDLVYLFDLLFGMASMGLVAGLVADPQVPLNFERLLKSLAVGAILGALLGLYQWLARHYGWPLSDINNAVNSDGFSHGHRFQGVGLFGWERARGTFKEPLAMATFLGASLPLVTYAAVMSRPAVRPVWSAGLVAVLIGLAVTDSALGWAATFVSLVITVAVASVALGKVRLATVAGVMVSFLVLIPLLASDPGVFSAVTSRNQGQLTTTVGNRTGAWRDAIRLWERDPIIGDGPGQSAVRLAYQPAGAALRAGLVAPVVLGSAQGIWAAALIDGGIVELMAWAAFLITLALSTGAAAARTPKPLPLAVMAATITYLLLAQVSGDRLDIQVWLTFGLALATCREATQRAGRTERKQPEYAAH